MTKFLDTYETWDKIFKLVKDDARDYYKIYVHDNSWNSDKMSTITMDNKELSGLIEFLQEFLNDQ